MSKICGIYKITNNINGMSYIGQSVGCMERWAGHKAPSSNVAPIDKAIKEFGKENFSFQILLECPPDMLDVWERDMINLHDTLYPKGYNMDGGGRSGFDTHEETRRKRRKSQKGENNSFYNHHHTEEAKRKISESMSCEKNPFYNHNHTEEARRKMSEAHKGCNPWNKGIKGIPSPLKDIPRSKPKWLTPSGEIRIMDSANVGKYHKDWIKIEE